MTIRRFGCLLLALCAFGCTTSDDGQANQTDNQGKEVGYTLVFERNSQLSAHRFHADGMGILPEAGEDLFEGIMLPEAQYRDKNIVSYYTTLDDCSGQITQFSVINGDLDYISVFSDLDNCDLEIISIGHTESILFLLYRIAGLGHKKSEYFMRLVSASNGALVYPDTPLDKKPIQGIFAGNRLFILSQNPDEINFTMQVFNTASGAIINEMNLNTGVNKIFKTSDENILIAYPDSHTIINSSTLGIISNVRYLEGKEPKFGSAEREFFDISGTMYYAMETSLSGTTYPRIPGVYDFSRNTAILYYFENFLSETDRKFKYEIDDTTVVSYDSANNLILIGYRKIGNNGAGGLLRIKPAPEPAFIDNIDLDGVPQLIFTQPN